nr:RNA-directed DNA polymerase, eukaryota, reverse transcriptase zinc-binding domain protein [Tanacetum cinerariifolium]
RSFQKKREDVTIDNSSKDEFADCQEPTHAASNTISKTNKEEVPSDLSFPSGFEHMKKGTSRKCSTYFARSRKKDSKGISNIHELTRIIEVGGKWINKIGDCFMINIYGPHDPLAKIALWNRISVFIQSHSGKFILFGDMNEVRSPHERKCMSHDILKALKPKIKQWVALNKSNEESRKKDLTNDLRTLDDKLEVGLASNKDSDNRIKILQEMHNLVNLDDLDTFQKARVKWDARLLEWWLVSPEMEATRGDMVTMVVMIWTGLWRCGGYGSRGLRRWRQRRQRTFVVLLNVNPNAPLCWHGRGGEWLSWVVAVTAGRCDDGERDVGVVAGLAGDGCDAWRYGDDLDGVVAVRWLRQQRDAKVAAAAAATDSWLRFASCVLPKRLHCVLLLRFGLCVLLIEDTLAF